MKLSKLANALREESLPRLAQEAAWRTLRTTRRAAFHVTGFSPPPAVRFRPIGYYRLQQEEISPPARQSILRYADAVLEGQYPLPGYGSPNLGPLPDWHVDWVSGKSWALSPSHRLQIVRHDGSDVKAPWELSRLQWSPVVAKAWALTGDVKYRRSLEPLLKDWILRNPVGKGVHWTVAMEAALRGISLCLTMELLWPFAETEHAWLALLERSLWQHLRFIEVHNEFSWLVRSNHYLSNLVGLTTLSACLRGAGMQRRFHQYSRATQREVIAQTYPDGGDREASTGYHLLVAQMALHSLIVQQRTAAPPASAFENRLRLMFEWLAAVADDQKSLPAIGDCDNGRVELLADDLAQAGLDAAARNGLKTGSLLGMASQVLGVSLSVSLKADSRDAAWFGPRAKSTSVQPRWRPVSVLPDSGIAVLRSGEASVVFSAMPNGLDGKGSHTHCDKLSFVLRLRCGVQREPYEVFCDTGSRGYTRSAVERNQDRSTAAHNTLTIDGEEQNSISLLPQHLFQSGNEAAVSPIIHLSDEPAAVRATHYGYARLGVTHTRSVELHEKSLLLIDEVTIDEVTIDEVTGASHDKPRMLDLNFILGPEWVARGEVSTGNCVRCDIEGPQQLTFACESAATLEMSLTQARIAREYGASLPATAIRIRTRTQLPATLQTAVNWS